MIGVEMSVSVSPVVAAGFERFAAGQRGTDVIRFIPPLIAQKSDVDTLIERLSGILADMA